MHDTRYTQIQPLFVAISQTMKNYNSRVVLTCDIGNTMLDTILKSCNRNEILTSLYFSIPNSNIYDCVYTIGKKLKTLESKHTNFTAAILNLGYKTVML